MRAVFFEAHADKQRVITEKHVEDAARGCGPAAVEELRRLVVADQLPLLRLLNETPRCKCSRSTSRSRSTTRCSH